MIIISLMNNKQEIGGTNPNRTLKFGLFICGLVAMLVLQSCGILDGSGNQVYVISKVNGVQVTSDKDVGIVDGKITLYKNGNIERKLNYRMQDGSDQQNVYEGTYKLKGNELAIVFNESTWYSWSPPNGILDGDTLIFYDPCVNCFGGPHVELYVRR
jgi:hypothetical protein